MENQLILSAGIKRHKGSLTGIALLMFFVSLTISAVLAINLGGGLYVRREMDRAGFGSITAWVSGVTDMEMLTDSILTQESVTGAQVQQLIFSDYEANGVASDSEGQLLPWMGGDERYRFFQDDLTEYTQPPGVISPGEIYVSPSMVSIMDLKIGDSISFNAARNSRNVSFKVAGYYEDPFMGSSMIGMKGFLISEIDYADMLRIISETGMDSLARNGAMLHIFTDGSLSAADVSQKLNENTPLSQYSEFMHSAAAIEGFMVILQNAFGGLGLAFSLVLLGVAMVILGHSISTLIEQDYMNMGILKTIGFTGGRLTGLSLVQYMAAIVLGMLAGMLAAIPLTDLAAGMTVTTTGILLPGGLPVLPCMAVFAGMLLLLCGFTLLKLRGIIAVTPMTAIRGERAVWSWNGRPAKTRGTDRDSILGRKGAANAFRCIGAAGFSLQLAMRQLWSGRRRYFGAGSIAALLVFFASMAGRMNAWLGPEGKGMMDAFNPADLDLGVQVLGELDPVDMERMVRSYTDITDSYLLAMTGVSVEGGNYIANVITEPERFHISEGNTIRQVNEIVITETAAADLGISVGDRVTVRGNVASGEFIVAGIYHCANDMGANIGMSRDGYQTIGEDSPKIWCYHYFLEEPGQKAAITQALENTWGGDVHVHENTWPGLFGIINAMHLLLAFMYGMIVIFVFIVTVMTGNKILAAEQKDLGIYKAMGCSSGMLRRTFSLRFGIVAILGAAAGTLLAFILTDPLVSAVMRLAGISNFTSHPTAGSLLIPGGAVTLLFLGFSYFGSRGIKKTDMTVLITE